MPQHERVRLSRVRAYQTSIIFGKPRLAKRGLKWLTFLGVAVPLMAGGIVLSLYSDRRPPFWIVAIAGLIATLQATASAWALVDNWEQKAKYADDAAEDADALRSELDTFYPGPDGTYNEEKLLSLEIRSYGGKLADRMNEIPQKVRDRARAEAEKRFPPRSPAPRVPAKRS